MRKGKEQVSTVLIRHFSCEWKCRGPKENSEDFEEVNGPNIFKLIRSSKKAEPEDTSGFSQGRKRCDL